MGKSKVKKGSRSKSARLKDQLRAIPQEIEDHQIVALYLREVSLITIDFMERFGKGEHRFFKEFRKHLKDDPDWIPDVKDIMSVLAACAHYAETYSGDSGTPRQRRRAMIKRLMADDLPDSLDEPDF